jgi:hypothetical protein
MIMKPRKKVIWLACLGLLLLGTVGAEAALFWENGLHSKDITVCFVGDSQSKNATFAGQVRDYMQDFEHVANIDFQFINSGVCPAATPHPSNPGNDYYDGDIRIILPGVTTVNPFGLVPGSGCPPDPNFLDDNGNYNGKNDGWGSWANPPNDLEVRRSCIYNVKLGTDGDAGGTPWRSHTLHEIGHAVGLSHEHVRNDVDPTCTASGYGGTAAYSGYMTPYDRNSVMHYQFLACGIDGNYSHAGFSALDRLALHIMYPEDNRVAEFVGTTVIRLGDNLQLRSAWLARGALINNVATNFQWRLNGILLGTGPVLDYLISVPGEHVLEFSYTDNLPGIPGRFYYYRGPVRVLRGPDFDKLMASTAAAQTAIHEIATYDLCSADFDGNSVVEARDLEFFASTFGRPDCRQGISCAGDLSGNRTVDGFDMALFSLQMENPDCY